MFISRRSQKRLATRSTALYGNNPRPNLARVTLEARNQTRLYQPMNFQGYSSTRKREKERERERERGEERGRGDLVCS